MEPLGEFGKASIAYAAEVLVGPDDGNSGLGSCSQDSNPARRPGQAHKIKRHVSESPHPLNIARSDLSSLPSGRWRNYTVTPGILNLLRSGSAWMRSI